MNVFQNKADSQRQEEEAEARSSTLKRKKETPLENDST